MSEGISSSEMERILLEDSHILEILPGEDWKFPEIDYNLWDEDKRERRRNTIESLQNFLRGPYIIDDFGTNHDSRRDWREKMARQYEWFHDYYNTNSMKYGAKRGFIGFAMANIYSGLKPEYKNQLDDAVALVKQKLKFNQRDYSKLLNEEKIEFIKSLKKTVYDVLNYLGSVSS